MLDPPTEIVKSCNEATNYVYGLGKSVEVTVAFDPRTYCDLITAVSNQIPLIFKIKYNLYMYV